MMRAAGALATAAGVELLTPSPWGEAALGLIAAALLFGLWARLAALLCAAIACAAFVKVGGELRWAAALFCVELLGLAVTGPGAHSVDSRRFGRRVIRLGGSDPKAPTD
jgi:hypothetical protein